MGSMNMHHSNVDIVATPPLLYPNAWHASLKFDIFQLCLERLNGGQSVRFDRSRGAALFAGAHGAPHVGIGRRMDGRHVATSWVMLGTRSGNQRRWDFVC